MDADCARTEGESEVTSIECCLRLDDEMGVKTKDREISLEALLEIRYS